MPTYLVAPRALLAGLPKEALRRARCVPVEELWEARWAQIEAELARGESLIAIGLEAAQRLRHLWVDTHPCAAAAVRPAPRCQLPLPEVPWRPGECRGVFVRPAKREVYFGADEMPRVEILPLADALDAGGEPCAYPAAWLKHTAGSLVGNRFSGSNWYVFAFADPGAALPPEGWAVVIGALYDHAEQRLSITGVKAHYTLYRPGETVLAHVRVANRSHEIRAAVLELSAADADGEVRTTRRLSRFLNPAEEVTVPWELPAGGAPGLQRIRVALYETDRFAYGGAREASLRLIEHAEAGCVLAPAEWPAVRPEIDGRALRVGKRDGFLAGTHYYPSSSWFDWAWRDFHPERAAEDIAQMRRLGYSLVRVWIDPELDEVALRGLDAWLALSGAAGIVSVVCVYTQWVRDLSYPDGAGMATFRFMGPRDYNVYSVQLLNVEHQRRYLATLARRWRDVPHLIWNLANETAITDPDPEQVDPRFFGDVEPKTGPLAGAAYFSRWADLMTAALRAEGAGQPILRGYGFIMAGDCYLQNREGDILPWHMYTPPEVLGATLSFAHPGLLEKPLLQEEFGIATLDEDERLERYEGVACWSVVMGAAGACSYEWGVSWMARELPYVATPLKDISFLEPDPRWFEGQIVYSQSWPVGSMGICPWAASFSFGSIYHGTPFPAPAAVALGRVADFCAHIGPPAGQEPVLLVVPSEWAEFAPHQGYQRLHDATMRMVHALAAAHVPFSCVQEDQLPGVGRETGDGRPATRRHGDAAIRRRGERGNGGMGEALPAVLLFPAVQPVRPETEEQLARLRARGVAVHTGGSAMGAAGGLSAFAVPLESDRPVWCLRRGTHDGHLYLLYAPQEAAEVVLRPAGASVSLRVPRYALVEVACDGSGRVLVGMAAAQGAAR